MRAKYQSASSKKSRHPFAVPFSPKRIREMSEAERCGPVASHRASGRRGKKNNEAEMREFLESQGLAVAVCETCGHVAGTNADCEECQ